MYVTFLSQGILSSLPQVSPQQWLPLSRPSRSSRPPLFSPPSLHPHRPLPPDLLIGTTPPLQPSPRDPPLLPLAHPLAPGWTSAVPRRERGHQRGCLFHRQTKAFSCSKSKHWRNQKGYINFFVILSKHKKGILHVLRSRMHVALLMIMAKPCNLWWWYYAGEAGQAAGGDEETAD